MGSHDTNLVRRKPMAKCPDVSIAVVLLVLVWKPSSGSVPRRDREGERGEYASVPPLPVPYPWRGWSGEGRRRPDGNVSTVRDGGRRGERGGLGEREE